MEFCTYWLKTLLQSPLPALTELALPAAWPASLCLSFPCCAHNAALTPTQTSVCVQERRSLYVDTHSHEFPKCVLDKLKI